MTSSSETTPGVDTERRAMQSLGISNSGIYSMIARALRDRGIKGGVLMDVGCGKGDLWPYIRDQVDRIIGVDAIRYPGFPPDAEFHRVDLDRGRVELPGNSADIVAAVETIEHLENPRAFMRELTRLVKPGGWVVVSTPNQLSLLSILSLALKKQFLNFQDVHYPAHLTALLEVDLLRIAGECGLEDARVDFSQDGRVGLTPWHYPQLLARMYPRALSDNLVLTARKPAEVPA